MKLKTVSVDPEAFRLLRREKRPRESYGDVVRRVFADRAVAEYDPSDQIDALFAEYGGKGICTEEGRARLRARRKAPPRSPRLARAV